MFLNYLPNYEVTWVCTKKIMMKIKKKYVKESFKLETVSCLIYVKYFFLK